MVIPQPLYGFLAALDTDVLLPVGDVCVSLFSIVLVVPFYPSAANDEEIAIFERDALFFRYCFEIGDCDTMARHGIVLDPLTFGVSYIVE